MRGRYFLYNSNSSDYTQVIQTTCGLLQWKIYGCPYSHTHKATHTASFFFKTGLLIYLGFRQTMRSTSLGWASEQPQSYPSFRFGSWSCQAALWAAAAYCSWGKTAMQSKHQLQSPQSHQLGKSVSLELPGQHRGARSALGTALVKRWPRISTHY